MRMELEGASSPLTLTLSSDAVRGIMGARYVNARIHPERSLPLALPKGQRSALCPSNSV